MQDSIKLYDFTKSLINVLSDPLDVKIEKELDGDKQTLSFVVSKTISVQPEQYLRCFDNEWVVKEVNITNEYRTVVAVANREIISHTMFAHFSSNNATLEETLDELFSYLLGTEPPGWTYTLAQDVLDDAVMMAKSRNIDMRRVSAMDVINQIANIFFLEVEYDTINKEVTFHKQRGTNKGAYFTTQLNLLRLDTKADSYDLVTRLIPIGKDDLNISSVNAGLVSVDNFQYTTKVLAAYWIDTQYDNALWLKMDAEERLAELSKPLYSYDCAVYDLSQNSTYSILAYDIGDEVTLIDPDDNVKYVTRIMKMTSYPYAPEKNSVELDSRRNRFEDIQAVLIDSRNSFAQVITPSLTISPYNVDGLNTELDNLATYSRIILLTNESQAMLVESDGSLTNNTNLYTQISTYQGGERIAATLGDVELYGSNNVEITGYEADFTLVNPTALTDGSVTLALSLGDNLTTDSGYIRIPITIGDTTYFKRLTWTKVYSGADGADGTDGSDGTTYYTWIRYATDINGSNMSSDPTARPYIGIAYNQTSPTPSSNPLDYTWSLYQGSDGVPGADGTTYYTWIKYADSPTTGMSDSPTGKLYIGLAFNKESPTESTDYGDYAWSLIKGEDGIDGIDGITSNLSNDSHVIPTDADGNNGVYTGATSQFYVYEGSTDVTASYNVVPSGTNVTYTGTNPVTITNLSADTGYVDFTATRSGYPTITRRFSLSKSKQGLAGTDGTDGTNGTDGTDGASATSYWLISDAIVIPVDNTGTPTVSGFTVNAYSQTGEASPAAYAGRWIIAEYISSSWVDKYTSSSDESQKIYTIDSASATKLRARLYKAGGTTIQLDEIVIPYVYDGTDGTNGTDGDDGTDGLTVVLTNQSVVIPTDSAGNNGIYTYSGTNIYLYEGATVLVYDGSGSTNGTWNVSAAGTGITAGTKSDGGDFATYGVASAMTTDTAKVVYTITGKRADGTAINITATQTFAKSKAALTAITALLTNYTHAIPTDADGNNASFLNSGTDIYVYEGSTLLAYDGTGTAAGTWKLTSITGTNVTPGTASDSGSYATISVLTGISANIGYTTYVIQGTRLDGSTAFSGLTVRQNYVKSKQGITGTPAQYVVVNGEQAFVYGEGNSVPTPSSITLTASLFGGLTTYDWEYWNGSAWANLGGTQTNQTYAVAYNATEWGSNTSLRVRCLSGTAYDEITLVKLYDGTSAVSGYLTNENVSVPASYDGTGYSLTSAGGTFKMYSGNVDKTTNSTFAITGGTDNGATWSKVQNGLTFTINETTGVYSLSGSSPTWTTDTENFTVTGTYDGTVITKVYTISKAKQGTTGSAGTNAQYVIVNGEQAFKYLAGQSTPVSSPIVLTATLVGGLTTYDWEYWNGSAWANLSGTQTNQTYSLAHDNAAWGSATSLRVRCLSGTAYDEITIVKLYDGTNGTNGTSAVVGYLTNENVNIYADYDGTGYSLSTAGGTFKMFSGITDVTTSSTFAITGGTDGGATWSKTQNGLTFTIDETSGVYSLSGASWTSDTETFTVTGLYNTVTVTKVYTISKSKQGQPGADAIAPTAYWLIVDANAINKSLAGVYTPSVINLTSMSQVGENAPTTRAGKFVISESTDGSSYTTKYTTTGSNEATKQWTPTAGIKTIKVQLQMSITDSTVLDEEIIPIVLDGATGGDGTPGRYASALATSQVFISKDGGITYDYGTIHIMPQLFTCTFDKWEYSLDGSLFYDAIPSHPAWVTSTAYVVGDYVTESGLYYRCVEDHTSGTFATDLAAVKWVEVFYPELVTFNAVANTLAIPSNVEYFYYLGDSVAEQFTIRLVAVDDGDYFYDMVTIARSYNVVDIINTEFEATATRLDTLEEFQTQVTNDIGDLTAWRQDIDDLLATIQDGGGYNLIRNSVGLINWNDGVETSFWNLDSGTATISTVAVSNSISKSGIRFTGTGSTTDKVAYQDIGVADGRDLSLYYTLSDTYLTGGSITVKATVSGTDYVATETSTGSNQYYVKVPGSASTSVRVTITATDINGYVDMSDLLLAYGENVTIWQQANGEIYTTNVLIDINGIKVMSSAVDGYTVINPVEFAGYYKIGGSYVKVFTVNQSVTELQELKINRTAGASEIAITMSPVKVITTPTSVDWVWVGDV